MSVKANIVVLPGDGIGPEVTAAGVAVLEAVARRGGHDLAFAERAIGGIAIDTFDDPLPPATLAACKSADAVLLGAVGGPKWSDPNAKLRPEQGLLGLRAALGVYANLRPVRLHAKLAALSPLKNDRLANVDLLFVRELTGGAYFGAKTRTADAATDECRYTVAEIERATRRAFGFAQARRRHVTHVDKANVLETSRLWRATVTRVAREFPDVTLEHQLVDSMAMLLLTRPGAYDVILTENLFGDILTDEAAALAGSLGLLPSASLGDGPPPSGLRPPSLASEGREESERAAVTISRGLYEPIHGSAPDIAGKGLANPLGTILSVALLLRHSLGLEAEAAAVESAVDAVIERGVLTRDLGGTADTNQVTTAVLEALGASSHAKAAA